MDRVELNIIALSTSESSESNFVVVLEETTGYRRLPIIIGLHEAQCIAIALEKMKTPRPMTHDIFLNSIEVLGGKVVEVEITDFADEMFHAAISIKGANGEVSKVDSRSSDAIAMAIRAEAMIYTNESVMEKASIVLDSPSKSFSNKRGSLTEYTMDELNQILKQVLAKEDFESAAKIRDAIKNKEES